MSKEERRKKNLRLVLKRGSVFAATIASVAVGQGVASADTIQPTDATSPVVSTTASENADSSTTSEKVTEVTPTTENSEPVTSEEPKTEEPKTEEPTLEEPKTEEPKTEEPKTEEPTPSPEEPTPSPVPSPEEPTPSPEEPRPEEPKPEEPTPTPTPEEPTPTPEEPTPTPEEPKPEEPKPEEPKPEEPKPEEPVPTPEEPTPSPTPENPTPEEPKPEEPKPEEPTVEEPKVKFKDKDKVSVEGNDYKVNSLGLTEVEVELPKTITPREGDSIIQTTSNGIEKRVQGVSGNILPVDSTLEYLHITETGEEERTLLGRVIDAEKYDTSAITSENKVDLNVPTLLDGDKLPEYMYLVSKDGVHTLTAKQEDGVYHFDSSSLPEGTYEFNLANSTTTYYGRKFKPQTFTLNGKPKKPVIEVPIEPSTPSPAETPTTPTNPNTPVTPTNPTTPVTPTNPSDVTPPSDTVKPSTPIVETPIAPEKPVSPSPSITNPSDIGGGTIITPQPQYHDNTSGNTNTGDNINIGGVSNQTNYVENPNKLTVGISSGSVKEVKATVSSQDGTSELSGRVVNGSFVADSLPDKDGVYTVKVQVTDDKGQTSEKTITYAVNKNGSTYDWLTKDVNGAYYQYLSEDLKLSEHSTTRLDTSKTKFTFTLDGKVVTVDSSLVKVVEKKEDDGSYTYTYTFNKDGFKDNGVWSISVATVDIDGHASSSNASVQFQFVLDNIVPELKVEGILNNGKYNAAKHQFKVLVKDNIGLARVRVLINGKVYEFTKEELLKGEKILDLERSDKPYSIEVEVVDLAGNTTTQKVEGITVSATSLDALLQSDNFKLIVGILGVGFLGSLLAWWFAAVKKRKRKEQAMEELRVGAHLLTEAEGLASSSGVGTEGVPSSDEPNSDETSELGGTGFAASEVLESIKDSAKTEVPNTGDVSELDDTTSTLPLEDSEKLSTLDIDPETAILDSEETGMVSDEETSVLDSAEETTSVLDSEDEETSVLSSEDEETSVLDETETTSVLDSDEETTSVLDTEDETTSVLDSEENTGKTDILEPSEDTNSLKEDVSKTKKPKSKGSRKSTKKSK